MTIYREDDQTFRVMAGSSIQHACEDAVKVANMIRGVVELDFNGFKIEASPRSYPRDLVRQYLLYSELQRALK